MAIAFDPRWRAFDANGNAYAGALLAIVDAGTSTPSTIYTDAALTIPAANPVVADSNGIFPQWFGPEATLYDIQKKTSGGVLIPGQSYVSVPAVGNQTGTLTRDFGSARFQARGAGGVTNIEVGDASPDNVGGTGRIGGWNGTQADLLTLDAALVNTTGRFKENSKKLASTVYTEATTFTTAATVDIALPNDPTGARAWEIVLWDFNQSTNAAVYARLSYDAGATYKAGATDYFSHSAAVASTGISVTADLTAAQITLAVELQTNDVALLGSGIIQVITPPSGTVGTRVTSQLSGLVHTGVLAMITSNGYGKGGYGKADHLRLLAASGTITGKYLVRPLRGYGET